MRSLQFLVKNILDRIWAAALSVLLAPLLLVVIILIKVEDGGTVLYPQHRAGRGGRPFRLIKLRTMVPNADALLDADGRPLGQRVTRIGRHLRRWSIDELPQVINILKGEMSFVGPRPVPLEYAGRMSTRQKGRFTVKPGLTGLAQVTGRHSLSWSQRVELDLQYIEKFSLLLDLRIMLRTFGAVADSQVLIDRGDPKKVDLG